MRKTACFGRLFFLFASYISIDLLCFPEIIGILLKTGLQRACPFFLFAIYLQLKQITYF